MARTLTANLAREYARTQSEIEEVLVEGFVSPEQEALEDAHLQARIESWDRDALAEQEDYCWSLLHEGEFGWEYEEALYLREQEEINRVCEAMTLVRGWINTRL